jgi:hypothetical protein
VHDRAWQRRMSRLRRPLTDQDAQPPKRGFCRLAHRRLLLVDRRISRVGRIFGSKLIFKGNDDVSPASAPGLGAVTSGVRAVSSCRSRRQEEQAWPAHLGFPRPRSPASMGGC